MAKYKIKGSESNDVLYYGMISGEYPNQFMTTRGKTNVFMFSISGVTDDGITIVSPMDNQENIITFDSISKIKSTDGKILTIEKYDECDKMKILNSLDGDDSVLVYDKETLRKLSVVNISFGKGSCNVRTTEEDGEYSLDSLLSLESIIEFDGK